MNRQDFEKLLDEFGALCNQEGLTGSENATDAANNVSKSLKAYVVHIEEELKKIAKWPDPNPDTGRGGPGPLFGAGMVFQYNSDRKLHEEQIAEILKLL